MNKEEINKSKLNCQCSIDGLLFLEDRIKELEQENKQLKERIDKAIEYIEHHYTTTERTGMMFHECENVISILKGDK